MLISSIIALILVIWFKTDAFLEYCRLFHLNSISFYKDFDTKQVEDASLTYHIYLRRYHNCFFVRLITCPICLGIWLGILAGVITFGFLLLIVNILSIPFYIVGGIVIFGIIDKLIS